jgi:predicted alpha/beta-hydrolase family hydrolase
MDFLWNGPRRSRTLLVLAHGASGAMDSPFMDRIAADVAAAGITVVRFEFPYMAARRQTGARRPPDREPVLRQTWLDVVAELRRGKRLVIGGKSMGGRIASMVADEADVRGLVCLGYPFHPPGRPERLRTAHLEDLRTPTLILQGERDPFGPRPEVEAYSLSPAIRLEWLPDGDHSFKPRRGSGVSEADNLARASTAVVEFVRAVTGSRRRS